MWASLWLACGPAPTGDPVDTAPGTTDPLPTVVTTPPGAPTFWADVQPITGVHCEGCHKPDDIGPFSLQTWEEAYPWAEAILSSIDAGTMPPWPPAADCAPLVGSRSLSAEDRATIAAWVDAGAPQGDPADAVSIDPGLPFVGNLDLTLAEPYAPKGGGDDYRCFVVDWPEAERKYVTSYQVEPDRREMVHHVILYKADGGGATAARNLDAQEPGPGYTCFGSSGVTAETLGAWVPGVKGVDLPPTTGVPVEPGSVLIVQMHYNTAGLDNPPADQTSMSFVLEDTVEKPAAQLLVLDPLWVIPGIMDIPAGATNIVHDTTFSGASLARLATDVGADPAEGVLLHRASLHMHRLGTRGSLMLEPAAGSDSCILDIPRWDFDWQGGYELATPLAIGPQDNVHLWCAWDNDEPGATDVDWGDGTHDEMCLSGLYVTRR